MPLDMQFVLLQIREDYTNRGSIVTPLKDRIGLNLDTLDTIKNIILLQSRKQN
jgi:hypothetical protein